jgi:hypothetical protein
MAEHPLEPGGLDHRFAARRDRQLLMAGLHARIEPASAEHGPRLVLTNLAGHAYPTGTVRRGLRVEVVYDADESTRTVLARLAPADNAALAAEQSALAPAEQRRIDLPAREGASRITCEIIYERNRMMDGSYELPLHRISASLSRPMRPPQ